MQLLTMHKFLIGTAMAGGLLFTAWSLNQWSQSAEMASLLVGVTSAAATVGLGVYLGAFIRKHRASGSPDGP